ncbi:MAG: hypothetical protein J6S63_03010 [Atopobiaceae bacterium]|nr:hypothetical protein [Atopobiaceae bacterium]
MAEASNQMNRMRIYQLIYALAAKDGRQDALFGHSSPQAQEAFAKGLCGTAFPELWFELPLLGDPWFDLHMLVSRNDVHDGVSFAGLGGTYADALDWFASSTGTRMLALSFDTGRGVVDVPAIQLLMRGRSIDVARGFLSAAGRPDAAGPYGAFVHAMPRAWYACYVGLFPARTTPANTKGADSQGTDWTRVECIVGDELQQAYAQDVDLLQRHLAQVGLPDFDDTLIPRVQELARFPFPLEFQFNVGPNGLAQPAFSASLRLFITDWLDPTTRDAVDQLWQRAQAWGLADDRWRQLANTIVATRVTLADQATLLYCCPAFLKLRWRLGEAPDAKAYLVAGTQ